jgi:uncharacterized membrane protein YvlD (DUF360 family)
MGRLLIRVLASALSFAYVLPMINGIHFHGNLVNAIVLGAVFGIMLWLVDSGAKFLTGVLTISTLGLALLVLIPMWIFGFWLLPAVALKLVADAMPAYLVVSGWGPAIIGGLVLMFVQALTGGMSFKVDFQKSE